MLIVALVALLPSVQHFESRAKDVAPVFKGYEATFILKEFGGPRTLVFNPSRAARRFPPCSTFKVMNSLVGLDSGVVHDQNTLFLWDGTHYKREYWNKDQTMESAFKGSVVWYYQELARRVGPVKMQAYLNRVPYGNRDISGGIDHFWLMSSLTISPKEQLAIVERLYANRLPFSNRAQNIVKEIMVQEDTLDWKYSGKTGSGDLPDGRGLGWFVGSVTYHGKRYIFATNIEGRNANGPKANELTHKALARLGITAYPLHPGRSHPIDRLH